jgi:predicted transcriptional regulator
LEQVAAARAGRCGDAGMLDRIADRLGLARRMLRDAAGMPPGDDDPTDRKEDPPMTDPSANLAQLAIEAVHESGSSMAAFARTHDIPYLSLAQLIKTGEPPRRKSVLEPLQKALGLEDSDFSAALAASRAQPTPGVAPQDDDADMTPLQKALQQVVRDRKMTMKAFAEAADLSVLTATRLLKRGELPGRTTTHEKLRSLLSLSEADYRRLLDDSRAAIDAMHAVPTAARPVDEDEPSAAAADHSGSTSTDELVELLDRLNPRQRSALKAFILTLV